MQMSPQEQAQKELWIKQTVEKAMELPMRSRSQAGPFRKAES